MVGIVSQYSSLHTRKTSQTCFEQCLLAGNWTRDLSHRSENHTPRPTSHDVSTALKTIWSRTGITHQKSVKRVKKFLFIMFTVHSHFGDTAEELFVEGIINEAVFPSG